MRFFFHYNKPASRSAGKPQITIHYKNQCLIVDNIICNVKTFGRIKKRQPHFVVAGNANKIDIKDNVANIS